MSFRRFITPPSASNVRASVITGLAWAIAIAALAATGLLAPRLMAPLPEPEHPTATGEIVDPRVLATAVAHSQLFSNQDSQADTNADHPGKPSDIALVGVATGFAGGTGFALFEHGGQSVSHRIGETVLRDWQLLRILPDRVELGAGSQRLELTLHTSAQRRLSPRPDAPEPLEED